MLSGSTATERNKGRRTRRKDLVRGYSNRAHAGMETYIVTETTYQHANKKYKKEEPPTSGIEPPLGGQHETADLSRQPSARKPLSHNGTKESTILLLGLLESEGNRGRGKKGFCSLGAVENNKERMTRDTKC